MHAFPAQQRGLGGSPLGQDAPSLGECAEDVLALLDRLGLAQVVLGGVPIDYPRGLAGHSDGDVIAHALTDALLGALARNTTLVRPPA